MIPFDIVVAIDQKKGIGKEGGLAWDLPGDLRHFKAVTSARDSVDQQNVVIMGRKTWESIPEQFRPLPGRINMVITRNEDYKVPEGVFLAQGLEQALNRLSSEPFSSKVNAVFVIGGAQIFNEAIKLPECRKIYMTHIHESFACDTFFPPFEDQFELLSSSPQRTESALTYNFAEYQQKH